MPGTDQPSPFRDQRQRRVAERLGRLVSPAAQAFFIDACRLMAASNDLQTTSHLVGHLVREVESSMRAVLQTLVDPVKGTDDNHRPTVLLILAALEIPESDPVGCAWLEKAGSKAKGGLHKRAHRNDLFQPRPVDDDFRRYWEEMQRVFDAVLDRFERHWLATHEALDRLLAKDPPTKDDVGFVLGKTPNNLVARGYFFDRLEHPSWLQPLLDGGAFAELPEVVREDGTVVFTSWPPAKYLARVAAVPEAQGIVQKVLLQLPTTDNVAVHRDLLEVIVALPPALARGLVPRVKEWLGGIHQSPVIECAGDLVVRLADGGEAPAAVDLATALLAVVPDPRAEALGRRAMRRPTAQMDEWHYERALGQCLPAISRSAPLGAFDLACDLLGRAIELSDGTADADRSWIWRPAIEDHAQNRYQRFPGLLVTAVRDLGRGLVAQDESLLEQVVQRLEARGGLVFRRLALDLLAEAGASRRDLVEARLLDQTRFEDVGVRHEYSRLLAGGFPAMPSDKQGTLLSWIEAGPDVAGFVRRWADNGRGAPTEADIERHRDVWRRDRLAAISTDLSPEWRARYDALLKSVGEPDHPEFPSFMMGSVGPTSPMSSADVKAMPIADLLEHLKTWKPTGQWDEPTMDGLGRELANAVAADSGKFAAAADRFSGLDATYVRSVFDGLEQALRAGREFDWAPALALAEWAMSQPRSTGDSDGNDADRDPDWGWARKSVASLLGFARRKIDIAERPRVWRIISALIEDPDPTPEHELEYGGSNMDPMTMSANTVRGEAMHAVFEYAIWVRQHLEQAEPGTAASLESIPEVKAALEAHLDPEKDASTTVRAVYGMRFLTLLWLDRDWIQRNLAMLFPGDPALSALRAALWEAALTNSASGPLWDVLQQEYRHAVDALAGATSLDQEFPDHVDHLVAHVMLLYLHRKIGLELGGFVRHFFETVPSAVRASAIDFVGRVLVGSPQSPATAEMASRAKDLWEHRLAEVRKAPASHARELASFGWWAKAPRLEPDWRIAQVATVLELAGAIDPASIVLEFLDKAVETHPLEAVRCVAAIAQSQEDRGGFTMWSREATAVLAATLESGDPAAEKEARELVNVMVARGHGRYADLLKD